MSEEKPESAPKPKTSKLPLILVLVNVVAALGVGGLVYYTKVMFKRPKITEISERQKLEIEAAKAIEARKKLEAGPRFLMKLEPIQANLKPTLLSKVVPGAPPPAMKAHYV
ncbi:hypothetical protein EON80_26870, partial [bacterium]